jgi:hypothetical protein
VGLGDTIPRLMDHIRVLEGAADSIGLKLNHAKCEIVGLGEVHRALWEAGGFNFIQRTSEEAIFLGSPLSIPATTTAIQDCRLQLEKGKDRLLKLQAHEAFFILKSSLGVPRLMFLLRTAPCSLSPEAARLDEDLRSILGAITNIQLSQEAWSQASLPVRWGGIGVRDITKLSPSAFLASIHSAASLMSILLPPHLADLPDEVSNRMLGAWEDLSGSARPVGSEACRQRSWDDGICHALSTHLLELAGPVDRARLLASSSPSSGAWLQAFPFANLGLRLGKDELRVAVGLRLGAPLIRAHRCRCGAEVDVRGLHGLSCRRSAGRHRRHALANDVILRAVRSANVHAELEPSRLLRGDGKRPDGATLDPWSGGRYLVWDFTCPDTLASSHLSQTSNQAGSAASSAEQRKCSKYRELQASGDYIFTPIAIETLGSWGPAASSFCEDLGARLARESGDLRSASFLRQRLGIAVQRGNAASVLGTLPLPDDTELV